MTLSADTSALLLTAHLRERSPFTFVRYGDGDLYCYFDKPPYGTGTPDVNGESATFDLNARLREATREFGRLPIRLFVGDFAARSAGTLGMTNEWAQVLDVLGHVSLLDVEALLIHRLSPAVVDFYRAARLDPRPSVYLAPERLTGAADWLGADHIDSTATEAHRHIDDFARTLADGPWEIVYVSAGRSTKPIIAEAAKERPSMTYIDLGSALEPLFIGRTRSGQIESADARRYFALSE